MKNKYKKLTIFFLLITVFFSGIFCCCLTDIASADTEELLPPCHQVDHADQSSQNSDECECDDTLATLDNKLIISDLHLTTNILPVENHMARILYMVNTVYDYRAPPVVYDSIPLYIKHSILRI